MQTRAQIHTRGPPPQADGPVFRSGHNRFPVLRHADGEHRSSMPLQRVQQLTWEVGAEAGSWVGERSAHTAPSNTEPQPPCTSCGRIHGSPRLLQPVIAPSGSLLTPVPSTSRRSHCPICVPTPAPQQRGRAPHCPCRPLVRLLTKHTQPSPTSPVSLAGGRAERSRQGRQRGGSNQTGHKTDGTPRHPAQGPAHKNPRPEAGTL